MEYKNLINSRGLFYYGYQHRTAGNRKYRNERRGNLLLEARLATVLKKLTQQTRFFYHSFHFHDSSTRPIFIQ